MANPPKEKNGCLWLILIGVFSIFGHVVIHSILRFSSTLSIVTSVILSVIFVNAISKGLYKKAMYRNGIIILIVVFGFKIFFGFLAGLFNEFDNSNTAFIVEENVKRTTIFEANDSITVFKSNRIWKDNFGNEYTGSLTVRERDFIQLKQNTFTYNGAGNFWGNLYNYMDRTEASSLDLVMDTFKSINAKQNLNQMEFAEMVISCVQDIPYSFVFSEKCLPAQNYEDTIKDILTNCPECCIGDIPYGVQPPVAFLQNLKGDCDTRTVFIYIVLKHFGYDVAILNSDFYKHSILGLHIAGSGDFKVYKGKKYLLWETTSKYFKAGVLPKNFNDIVHWDVVLTSK